MPKSLSDFELPRDPDGPMEAATKQYVDAAGVKEVVYHGSDSTAARPSNTDPVLWIGTAEPSNATEQDLWYDSDATVGELTAHGHPQLCQTVVFTTDGTFSKADYSGIEFVRVRCVGGGGGAGGTNATGAGEGSAGGGGGGGEYAESVLHVDELAASETVTVGAGGSGGTSGGGTGGSASSFGAHVVANGGGAGGRRGNTNYSGWLTAFSGTGGSGGTGDILVSGNPGSAALVHNTTHQTGGAGGASTLGAGGEETIAGAGANSGSNGDVGKAYGGGGGGAAVRESMDARTGGSGANGVVIVDVFIQENKFDGGAHEHDADYVNETDHTKAAHDSLNIDADTVDGSHAADFATSGHNHNGAYVAQSLLDQKGTALTNDTVSALNAFEAWGTETITFTDPGAEMKVSASVSGWVTDGSGTNGRVVCRVRVGISLDGGSTYQYGSIGRADIDQGLVIDGGPQVAQFNRLGTPTGDIIVRAEIRQNLKTAGDAAWQDGWLSALMLPA